MLSVSGLRFRYRRDSEELFAGLDHAFRPNSITVVTGASGRGKSTLLYVLGLLLQPSAGTVAIDGRSSSDLDDVQRCDLRARRIGFVFQDAMLDASRPVLDAVLEPALYAGRRRRDVSDTARRLLAEFGVEHRADHRPGEISGGQAQRVAVCRALMNDPAIVLADEPTGNLDQENAASVLDSLRAAADAGRTVVVATHDPFVAERADEMVAL